MKRLLGAALALCSFVPPAGAVVTATWSVETYQQFDAGDASSAFITSAGELRPGWDTKRTALEGDAVWSALHLADGSVLLGADVDGTIFKDGKKLVSIPSAIAVVSLAQTADGTVWAGTMPGAKLWRIDVAGRKAIAGPELPSKDVETVWSLAAAGDTLYAGTGPKGRVFAIAGGRAKQIFDSEDKRITAITATSDGAVWFGTSDRALVFRYDPKSGQTRAMADFAGNEVSAIAPYRDGVVVAANELAETPPTTGKTAAQLEAAEKPNAAKGQTATPPAVGSAPGADKDPVAVADLGRKGAKKGKGALFHVGTDGRLDQLHALTAAYFTSIAVAPDGAVYAGASDKGRVYMVDLDGSVATAFDVDERAVSQVWIDHGLPGFATDDAAAMYKATGRASAAKYVSDVLDAKAVARFGKLAWTSNGKVALETRSGNTARPGVGWSAWQTPSQLGAIGGETTGGAITSPPGRYFQFRVALDTGDARVRRIVAYYVPQNMPTEVQEVTVEPAAKVANPVLEDSAAKPRSPILKVTWKIENPDGDDTTYKLEARRDGEANWRPIATGKAPVTGTSWEWNTETYPDGWYKVRVTSSDAAANSPDRALGSTATSTMFAIDNTRPELDRVAITYPKATARAHDAISTIAEMAYSVDDGPWQLGTTADGLFDDLTEDLRIDIPTGLTRGPHTLAIRVADAAGNIGSTSTTFVVK